MTTYAIIAAVALVTAALVVFGIWFAHKKGQQSGAAVLRADLAEEETQRAQRAGQILADPRSDDDTIDRLRKSGF